MPDTRSLIGSGHAPLAALAVSGVPTNVTAAGTSQGTATPLPSAFCNVTAASSNDGVVLPTAAQGSTYGDLVVVGNVGSTTAKVYPGGSDTVAGSASAINVAQHKLAVFARMSGTAWLHFVTA